MLGRLTSRALPRPGGGQQKAALAIDPEADCWSARAIVRQPANTEKAPCRSIGVRTRPIQSFSPILRIRLTVNLALTHAEPG